VVTTPELSATESLTLAKNMLADIPNLKVSEAKVMFTVLTWFIAGLYKLGWEITRARGDEKPQELAQIHPIVPTITVERT